MTTALPILQLIFGFAISLVVVVPVYPHGGGLDASGWHQDRKRGGYHCHRAQSIQTEAPNKSKAAIIEQKPSTPDAPVTHIGPRGGRYHYSASGKKVYERRK